MNILSEMSQKFHNSEFLKLLIDHLVRINNIVYDHLRYFENIQCLRNFTIILQAISSFKCVSLVPLIR